LAKRRLREHYPAAGIIIASGGNCKIFLRENGWWHISREGRDTKNFLNHAVTKK